LRLAHVASQQAYGGVPPHRKKVWELAAQVSCADANSLATARISK